MSPEQCSDLGSSSTIHHNDGVIGNPKEVNDMEKINSKRPKLVPVRKSIVLGGLHILVVVFSLIAHPPFQSDPARALP